MAALASLPARVYSCARCGTRLKGDWLYSRFTGERYCTDVDACARRAKRGKR